MTRTPQRIKTNEARGVTGRSTSGFPVEFSPCFHISFSNTSFNSQNVPGKESGYREGGNQGTATNSHFPEKHTAFDQSLIPHSAVVKGCVLERYLALKWK